MRIAICDDNKSELFLLTHILEDYVTSKEDVEFDVYSNASDLLDSVLKKEYDVLILDILMPGLNGIEAAREIRRYDETVEIIFLTSSPEFAVDSYDVRAFYYMLKPISSEKIRQQLDLLYERLQKSIDQLSIVTPQSIFSLPYHKIEFVEVMNKTLFFHLSNGTSRQVHASLSDYESKLLARPSFCKVHRSYLVNLKHMQTLNPNTFQSYSGKTIPISRYHYKEVREAYIKHLFKDAEEV